MTPLQPMRHLSVSQTAPTAGLTCICACWTRAAAILQVAQLVLATLFSPATPTAAPEVQPPFSANLLDSSEGSGAAMEDWLQAVAVGGEGNDDEGEAAAAAAGVEEDEELDEVLVPGEQLLASGLAADAPAVLAIDHLAMRLSGAVRACSVLGSLMAVCRLPGMRCWQPHLLRASSRCFAAAGSVAAAAVAIWVALRGLECRYCDP